MQSRNQFVMPLILLREHCRYLLGRQKKQVEGLFFCTGIIGFDLALHMMSFPYCMFYFLTFKNKIKNLGRICRIFYFSLGISDFACVFT
jgi:hypothetical protein